MLTGNVIRIFISGRWTHAMASHCRRPDMIQSVRVRALRYSCSPPHSRTHHHGRERHTDYRHQVTSSGNVLPAPQPGVMCLPFVIVLHTNSRNDSTACVSRSSVNTCNFMFMYDPNHALDSFRFRSPSYCAPARVVGSYLLEYKRAMEEHKERTL